MVQLYQPKSSAPKAQPDNLFSGIWIRWQALTLGERFVCANFILIPLWWVSGLLFMYMPLILLVSVAVYECLQHGKLRLKRPNSLVVSFFLLGLYEVIRLFFLGKIRGGLVDIAIYTFCPACWLWYIQSNKIRIRIEVVAWACTISVIQMLGFWALLQFVLPTTIFPQLNLFGLLTGQVSPISYMMPLELEASTNPIINSLYRINMFFSFPELFSVVAGFMAIVALDVRKRLWSWLLFLACVVLIFLGATRMMWLAFPITVGLRYVVSNFGKLWVPPTFFAVAAVVSFTTFSIPPATNLIVDQITQSAQTVDNLRASATDARLKVYTQTWKEVQENPLWGYRNVEQIGGGGSPPAGTHSVILGSLLHQKGLVGTVIFIFFWISLFLWFYKTRAERPLACICVWFFYTLVSPTVELVYEAPVASLLILLCAVMYRPQLKSVKGIKPCVSS